MLFEVRFVTKSVMKDHSCLAFVPIMKYHSCFPILFFRYDLYNFIFQTKLFK